MIHRFALRDRREVLSDERAFRIIRAPLLTEKSTRVLEHAQYVFKVLPDANKVEIARAVERLFDVKVVSVNTVSLPGKRKRFKGRSGRRSGFKKAVVRLGEGSSIDMTAGVK